MKPRPRVPESNPDWYDYRQDWEKGIGYPPVPRWQRMLFGFVMFVLVVAVMLYAVDFG